MKQFTREVKQEVETVKCVSLSEEEFDMIAADVLESIEGLSSSEYFGYMMFATLIGHKMFDVPVKNDKNNGGNE